MGKKHNPSLRLQAKVDLGALKENEVSWLSWIWMVGWMNRADRMGCVGSCFVDPHGLSCNFAASEKFAPVFFFHWRIRTEVARD